MDLENKKVTVMGLGLFGGGVSAVKYLVKEKADVLVTDLRESSQLKESITLLQGLPIQWKLGMHREEDFQSADLIVVNPGVPDESKYLKIAQEHNIPLETEINIFFKKVKAPVIGITGSNGKSTTTAMIHHILKTAGYKTWLGGNIGKSLLEELPNIKAEDRIIMELSSFQLERLAWAKISPQIAVVTNLSCNHLDRHKTMQNYAKAKQNILRFQKPNDYCILNGKDSEVSTWGKHSLGQKAYFSVPGESNVFEEKEFIVYQNTEEKIPILHKNEIPIPGEVYGQNAMAAIATTLTQNISPKKIKEALQSFQGLPHRLERIKTSDNRRWYNDSDATTAESSIAALKSVPGPIILIAGGSEKGINYEELAKHIVEKVKILIVMGATGQTILKLVQNLNKEIPKVQEAKNLEEAVKYARELSSPEDAILLSPASASFGMFRNFAERGEIFKKLVQKNITKKNT